MLLNQVQFIHHRFDSERILKESKIRWQPLTPSVPTDFAYTVER